jgi:hypothetical protein
MGSSTLYSSQLRNASYASAMGSWEERAANDEQRSSIRTYTYESTLGESKRYGW